LNATTSQDLAASISVQDSKPWPTKKNGGPTSLESLDKLIAIQTVSIAFLTLGLFSGNLIYLDVMDGDSIPQLLDFGVNLVIREDITNETIALCEVSLIIQKTITIAQRFFEVAQDLMCCWD
jgi:hypothetical protein